MKKLWIFAFLLVMISGCAKSEAVGKIVTVSAADVLTRLDEKEDFVLVIGTTTCTSCQSFHETMAAYIEDHAISLFLLQIDNEPLVEADNGEEVRRDFLMLCDRLMPIESTPTVIWIKGGEMVNAHVGAMELDALHQSNQAYGLID